VIPHDPLLDSAYGAQVWAPYVTATFTTPTGALVPALSIAAPAGDYSSDSSRWPRVECELRVPVALTPDRTASPVSPYGGGLVIEWGVSFLGQRRGFRLATLAVVETRIDRPSSEIIVSAASYEARVDEDRYTTPSDSPAGTATALITAIVRRTMGATHPVVNRVPPGSDTAFPVKEFTYVDGPWGVVEEIADAAGLQAWFDANGALVIAPAPVKGTPVLTYKTGPGGSITGYESVRGWAPNRVAVVYENEANARVVGLWEDTDPNSATRVTGPYGRHTDVTKVSVQAPANLPSQATANAAAATRAKRVAARYRSVELRTIPAPWIEPGDTVGANLLGGTSETLIVGRHAFPLDALDVATVTALDDTYTRDLGTDGRTKGKGHNA
jgi:hypothetical protein